MPTSNPNQEVAMQTRCIFCRREQYGPAVWSISHGEQACCWCGETPPILTEMEYREKMATAWNKRHKEAKDRMNEVESARERLLRVKEG